MFKKIFAALVCVLTVIGCMSTNGQGAIKPLEQMSDVEYTHWKLYIELGVKIGAHRLLTEKIVTQNQLVMVATVVDSVVTTPLEAGATSLLIPALQKAGFNNDEATLVIMVVDQELMSRGALKWVDPATGLVSLSPRTKEVLGLVSSALRTAGNVSEDEHAKAVSMGADFGQVMIRGTTKQ